MKKLLPLLLLCGSCSFTVATGFTECAVDRQCGSDKSCLEGYCLPLPKGCSKTAGDFDSTNRIVFAAVLPISDGSDAGIDLSEMEGLHAMQLAVDEANQRDGIKGKKFTLYSCDSFNSDTTLKEQLGWMTSQLKVPAVLTSGSTQTLQAMNEAVKTGTLVMSATATSPELIASYQANQHLLWRTAPPDTLQARVIATLLSTEPSLQTASKIGILYVDSPYGQGVSGELAQLLSNKTVSQAQYTRNGDVAAAVSQLASSAPQVTVLVGFPPDVRKIIAAAKAFPALTRANGHQWLFTDSAKDPAILDGTTFSELSGSLGTAPAQGAGAAFPSFRSRFQTRFSVDPANYSFTSHSYDAMTLVLFASAYASGKSTAGLTGKGMAEGLGLVSSGISYRLEPSTFTTVVGELQKGTSVDLEGASGPLNFDLDAGAPPAPYEVWKVEADAGFGLVKTVSP